LRRNFQGYTTDAADALIAFGASSISELPQGFAQAARDTLHWSERIERGESPVTRGLVLTAEDRMRGEIIERLMCDLSVDFGSIVQRHGFAAGALGDMAEKLQPMREAGIVSLADSRISVPKEHRLFLRNVATVFDAYFAPAPNRHARAV
jgi:oxygen-independent coproporphyrinogen-3 oxidase